MASSELDDLEHADVECMSYGSFAPPEIRTESPDLLLPSAVPEIGSVPDLEESSPARDVYYSLTAATISAQCAKMRTPNRGPSSKSCKKGW